MTPSRLAPAVVCPEGDVFALAAEAGSGPERCPNHGCALEPAERHLDAWRRVNDQKGGQPWFELGNVFESRSDWVEAEAAYREAAALGHGVAARNLGNVLRELGDFEGSESAYRRAAELADARGAFNLALVLERAGRSESEIEAAYARAEELGSIHAPFQLGMLSYARGDVVTARQKFRLAAARGDGQGAFNAAILAEAAGDLAEAESAYDEAVRSGVEEARANLAFLLERRRQPEGTLELHEAGVARPTPVMPMPDLTSEQRKRNSDIEALLDRYEASGDPSVVEEVLQLLEEAIAGLEDAPDLRGYYRNAEANAYQLRYEHDGDSSDVGRAVSALEAALEEVGPDAPQRLTHMSHLAMLLWLRYKREGDLSDLRRSLEIDESVLDLMPPHGPGLWEAQRDVATNLVRAFTHTRDARQLERAVQLLGDALSAVPPGGVESADVLDKLANVYYVRFEAYGDTIDVHMARATLEQALAVTSFGSDRRTRYLGNLGWILLAAYDSSRVPEPADLDAAVHAFENALAVTGATSPDRAPRERNLAVALVRRFERSGSEDDLVPALDLFRAAAAEEGSPPEVRLDAAMIWGRAATLHRRTAAAADAWGTALEVMRELFVLQSLRTDKEAWLTRAEGVSAEAALARTGVGDTQGAAVALENGRALMLAEALALRADVDILAGEGRDDLHARFVRAVTRLEAAQAASALDDLPIGGASSG